MNCLFAAAVIISGCGHDPEQTPDFWPGIVDRDGIGHEMIVLGEKLEDPYSVSNIDAALKSLYGTKATAVRPTDIYLRFRPRDEKQYQWLLKNCDRLLDHPMDYAIEREGDYYHDPSIPSGEITWQYAVVDSEFKFPVDIEYELLDMCYIPQAGTRTKSGGMEIDWDAVERESFRLTGNEVLFRTKADEQQGPATPKGRICVKDENSVTSRIIGVAGVKVSCNTFVKFDFAYTDNQGYFEMKKTFSSSPRYRIVFQNRNDFAIGFDLVVVSASVSTLGEQPQAGFELLVTRESDRKLFSRCAMNNAANDYYSVCGSLGVVEPPAGMRLWIIYSLGKSSTVMFKHGAVLEDNALMKKYLGEFVSVFKYFSPDIIIGALDVVDYSTLYALTIHELAHSSHFAQVGKDWWNKYASYVVNSFFNSPGEMYGTGTEGDAGYCAVGEMWAYYMENKLYAMRYTNSLPTFGISFWFKPQILEGLDDAGISTATIFKALTGEVRGVESLKEKLKKLDSSKSDLIDKMFAKYVK